jgi:anti-sigma B factor antagonist
MDVMVDERPTGQPTVVRIGGHLDIDSAPELRTTVDALLDRDVTRIVVDLADLWFCDSIGLSTFLTAHNRCAAAGGYVRLAAPAPFLLRVITVVGLRDKLLAYRSVAEACAGDPAGLLREPDPQP